MSMGWLVSMKGTVDITAYHGRTIVLFLFLQQYE